MAPHITCWPSKYEKFEPPELITKGAVAGMCSPSIPTVRQEAKTEPFRDTHRPSPYPKSRVPILLPSSSPLVITEQVAAVEGREELQKERLHGRSSRDRGKDLLVGVYGTNILIVQFL